MTNRLLVVGLPGADRATLSKHLDSPYLPHTLSLVERGVLGDLYPPRPTNAAALWTSLATGVRLHQHGVHASEQLDLVNGRLLPATAHLRQVPALWDILATNGYRCLTVGWPVTHASPASTGCIVSDLFGHPNVACTPNTLKGAINSPIWQETLANCWVMPEDIDCDLLSLFVPLYQAVEQGTDPRLAKLGEVLSHTFSLHSAALALMADDKWDAAFVCYPLLPTLQSFCTTGPKEANGLFLDAVNAGYRLLDRLLGILMTHTDSSSLVGVFSPSGYGLRTDGSQNTVIDIRNWSPEPGLFLMTGAEIKADALLQGASVLDVVPSLLHALHLPVGSDLKGRVLAEAFTVDNPIEFIPSWQDSIPTPSIEAETPVPLDTLGEALNRLLMFIPESPDATKLQGLQQELRIRETINLSSSFLDAELPWLALDVLEPLYLEYPEDIAIASRLIKLQLQLGLIGMARQTAQTILESAPDTIQTNLLMATIETRSGRYKESLAYLQAAAHLGGSSSLLDTQFAFIHLQQRQWLDAANYFTRVLAREPNNPQILLGKARALLALKHHQKALDLTLEAIGQVYHQPLAHYLLGIILKQFGELNAAEQAFEVARRQAPNAPQPHYQLLRLKRIRGVLSEELKPHQEAIRKSRRKLIEADTLTWVMRHRAKSSKQEITAMSPINEDWLSSLSAPLPPCLPVNLILVSGLPDSGACLILEALRVGGVKVLKLSDTWGWSEATRLPCEPADLEKIQQSVAQVPSALIPMLPRHNFYHVIFIKKCLSETVMPNNLADTGLTQTEALRLLARHQNKVLDFMRRSANIDVLELDGTEHNTQPSQLANRLASFLAPVWSPSIEAMANYLNTTHHDNAKPISQS